MFHSFTVAGALFAEDIHPSRGPNSTFTIDDFVGPDWSAAGRAAAAAAGLPYLKGGMCETGGTAWPTPLQEAQLYTNVPGTWGPRLKDLMRAAPFRLHVSGLSMIGEDMPQLANVVDLDPSIRDMHGLPVPRITHSPHRFEEAASLFYGPKLASLCAAAPGALAWSFIPAGLLAAQTGEFTGPLAGITSTLHVMGTARMGVDPRTSVVDRHGRMHDVGNVVVADGSVFVSAGGFNPTLTIMALALRAARYLAAHG
jgi:gluconate 2-dehydrogenase alpha chain